MAERGAVQALQARARDYIEAQNQAALEKARALGVEQSLVDFEGLTPQMIVALAEDGVIDLDCLPGELLAPLPLPLISRDPPPSAHLAEQLGDDESRRLHACLRHQRWNISGAASELGISRSTLYRKMKNLK